jgi:hypothetical protein
MDFKIKWNDAELIRFGIRNGRQSVVSIRVAIFVLFLEQMSNC